MKIQTQKIQKIMRQRKMTLEDLRIRMGMETPQAAWYRINNAKTLRTIEAIAKALRVKVNAII